MLLRSCGGAPGAETQSKNSLVSEALWNEQKHDRPSLFHGPMHGRDRESFTYYDLKDVDSNGEHLELLSKPDVEGRRVVLETGESLWQRIEERAADLNDEDRANDMPRKKKKKKEEDK